jgi:threonine dehydrogenase-like Zn-dependent dehydrogenase
LRAAVTREKGRIEVADIPEPGEPGAGQALVRPEAVGICGSDFHLLAGELETHELYGPQFPRIQGHEVAASVEAVGPGCPEHLQPGRRVAIYPLTSCGECYACRAGRLNVCANFKLIGIHVDGGLQERFVVPAAQLFDVGDQDALTAAFVEPVSIAVQAVRRARVAPGERVVVLGAGPIGQAISLVVKERGATVLLVDRLPSRLELGRANGAEPLDFSAVEDTVARAVEWSGGEGPAVVFDATGEPAAIRDGVDMVAPAGRVVVVGISHKEVTLRVGAFTEKEIDLLGSTICGAEQFAEAVDVVGRNRAAVEQLVSRQFGLEEAPEAMQYAMDNPADVMKVVVRPTS